MHVCLIDTDTNETIYFLPPPEQVLINTGPKIYTISPIQLGDVEIPRGRMPVQFSWEGLFPGELRKLPNMPNFQQPSDIIEKIKTWSDENKRLRLLITPPWNMLVYIKQFEPRYGGGYGDVNYSISFVEWREIKIYKMEEAPKALKSSGTFRADTKPAAKTYTVKPGDSLWKIAKMVYGAGGQWQKIYQANKDKIKNPDLIYPGQIFQIP